MAGGLRPPNCCRAPSDGGRGAPTRPCICGPPPSSHQHPGKSMNARPPETFALDRMATPIGTALLVTDADGALRALDWEDHEPRLRQLLRLQYGAASLKDAQAPKDITAALTEYFAGDLASLNAIRWR